MKKGTLNQQAP